MKSIHFLNRKFLLFFAVLFMSYSAWAQLNFRFKFTNEYYAPLHTTDTYTFPSDEPGEISLDHHLFPIFIDLSDQICEGDIVIVDNYSNGSYGAATISGTTPWDAKWGKRTYDGGGGLTGWDVFANLPIENQLWDFWDYEKTIAIPNSADDTDAFTYHRLYIAPELGTYYQGAYDSSTGCSRVLELIIKVKTAPRCLDDLTICPGDVIDDNSLGIAAGVTAGTWHPADPRIVPPTETTDYTYILDNGTCTFDCSMKIVVNNPNVEFTELSGLCYDDVFTFTEDDFWALGMGDTYPVSITVDGEVYEEDDLPIVISGSTHGAGVVNIEYHYYNGTLQCSKTYEVEIFSEIEIDLPSNISMCDTNFETLCGPLSTYPSPIYTYAWWGPDPELMESVLLSNSRCFTPESAGNYVLIVTDENGCTKSHHISIVFYSPIVPNLPDVSWCPDDMTMLVRVGWFADPFADHPCEPTYEWTFDGAIIGGADTYNAPFVGNGTYCVTVNFEFSSTTRCFEVIECCPPDPAFYLNWAPNEDGSYSLVLVNVSTDHYVEETYYLEKDCNNDGTVGPWEFVGEITRDEDFDTPVDFGDLDPSCFYRITHRVPSPCKMQVYVHAEYFGGSPGHHNLNEQEGSSITNNVQRSLTIAPNPTASVANLFIENIEGVYQVDIYNLQGQLLKSLQTAQSRTEIDLRDLESGIYLIKASNGTDSFTRRVVKM